MKNLHLSLSLKAMSDLDKLTEYIDENYPEKTKNVLDTIENALKMLCTTPGMGSRRPQWTSKDLRFLPVLRYWIIYEETPDELNVVHIVGQSMDLDALLGN